MIETPPKIWRPKIKSKYIPVDSLSDVDDGLFDYTHYGKCVFRPGSSKTQAPPPRQDLIPFDPTKDKEELDKHFKIGEHVSATNKQRVLTLIKRYWDCFCKEGAKRTILGYEFSIDTGGSQPVCTKQTQYGPHETKIIMEQIQALLKNDWIEECDGPWGSIIVLAPKPHQEHITHIDDFVWRMCVSYRSLNRVTLPFTYPIPRCDDAINILNIGSTEIYLITVDAKQGYHQVAVKLGDRAKLAFFAPNNRKYTFKVMPFGPTNAPAFYTCMMQDFAREWDALFYDDLRKMSTIGNKTVKVSLTHDVFIDGKLEHTGSKGIIDDILIWSTHLDTAMIYFECVCKLFLKYRVSFRLDKCEFLKNRVEYVGHDLTPIGNCPAQSKFDMIQGWPLPTTSQALHSFIGLINFYHNYAPYFEIRLKPLRQLYRRFLRSELPILAWTPASIQLFEDMKACITSSPVLARYDPSKPTMLKTDWSAEGMGFILMQPADDNESKTATAQLQKNGTCLFDLSMNGARLKPVRFGSRSCTDTERNFHSFVGEAAAGRWAIAQNRRYLWGSHFYWICDCSAMREILEYQGTIAMVQRWSQELLGYHFTIIHRPARMMKDVDALSRRYGSSIGTYLGISNILTNVDTKKRPSAYDPSVFANDPGKITKITSQTTHSHIAVPTLCTKHIHATEPIDSITEPPQDEATVFHVSTRPIILHDTPPSHISSTATNQKDARPINAIETFEISCISFDDILGSFWFWSTTEAPPPVRWAVIPVFSTQECAVLTSHLHATMPPTIMSLHTLTSRFQEHFSSTVHIVDLCFIPYTNGSIFDWFEQIMHLVTIGSQPHSALCLIQAWVTEAFMPPHVLTSIKSLINLRLPQHWEFQILPFKLTDFNICIDATRLCFEIWDGHSGHNFHKQQTHEPNLSPLPPSIDTIIHSQFNTVTHTCPIVIPDPTQPPVRTSPAWPHRHRIIAKVASSHRDSNGHRLTSLILDPAFPGIEPDHRICNDFLGHRFGIPFKHNNPPRWHVRPISTLELLRMYSIHDTHLQNPHLLFELDNACDTLLPHCIPPRLRSTLMNDGYYNCPRLVDTYSTSSDSEINSIQCLLVSKATPAPCLLDWTDAYQQDPDTAQIITHLMTHKPNDWPKEALQQIHQSYHRFLKRGQIQTLKGKLVLFKPILNETKHVGLIIVPSAMRRKLFTHYHAGPSGGHMGEYKTLYRLRARFFWPHMREDIKTWVKTCAHCIAYNVWRDRRSEVYFSWPVTVPFWIMHVDLWSPGDLTNNKGEKGYLMNALCDLTQFVVSVPTFNVTADYLGQLFMEHIFLSFGCCAVIVVDDGSNFKGSFEAMCGALGITFWALSRGNHKGNSAERYHRFLNKTQAINGNDRGTHQIFIQNAKTSQYAWNSAPIDGTDVTRSMAAIGREFRFPLDVSLLPDPPMNDGNQTALYQYLRDVSNDSAFATSIVQILVEERRLAHVDRHNNSISKSSQPPFKVGDVVKAHVQVQSNATTGTVKKLSYRARGPFQITRDLGHNSFEVQRYGKPDSQVRKYKSTELYLLPPAIYPSEPLDTIDQRYLSYEYTPIHNPLKKPLGIELYNTKYFHPRPPRTTSKQVNKPSIPLDDTALNPHRFPSIASLHQETQTQPPTPEPDDDDDRSTTDSNSIHHKITTSQDKLFFVKYCHNGTLRPRWYLIQVDLVATEEVVPDHQSSGVYYCGFLARHPNDKGKSDEFSRWWPDWYEYTKCPETDDVIFGDRILFPPTRLPDSTRYVQWAEELNLANTDHVLVGPFNFEPISVSNRTRSKVAGEYWRKCYDLCVSLHLLPPTTGSNSSMLPIPQARKKRKNDLLDSEKGAKESAYTKSPRPEPRARNAE